MATDTEVRKGLTPHLGGFPTWMEAERPSNPELRKICDDVAAATRLLLAAELVKRSSSPEPLQIHFRKFVAGRGRQAQSVAKRRVAAILASSLPVRELYFGRYAKWDTQAAAPAHLEQMFAAMPKLKIDAVALRAALPVQAVNERVMPQTARLKLNHLQVYRPGAVAAALDKAQGAKYKKLGLFIKRVDCLEETDEVGADEIAVGGSKTQPDGSTQLIDQFMIDDDFDVGESKVFPGNGKKFAEWNLVTDAEFPCVYGAVMAMAEKDDGGFHAFLVELWKLVGEAVTKEVTKAVGALIGTAIGSAFGGIGAAIGAAIGWLFGVLVNWVIELFDNPDDIVGTKTFLLGLGAATQSYYEWAKLVGAQNLLTTQFIGDGGRYRVWWHYRVYA